MSSTLTIPSNIHSWNSIDIVNTRIFEWLGITNLEEKSPNEFFLEFKNLFLNSNSNNVSDKIKEIQVTLENQDFYDYHLFFIKYFSSDFWGWEEIFFTTDLFEKSYSIDDFLDNLSQKYLDYLFPLLEYWKEHWYWAMTFTTKNIRVSSVDWKSMWKWIFNMNTKEEWKEFLYNCIRYFIIWRWLNFPKVVETKRFLWTTFQEDEYDSIFSLLTWEKKEEINQNFPNAKDFLISLFKKFSITKKSGETDINQFVLWNMFWSYIWENAQSFSFEDSVEIVKVAIESENTFFSYMLSTEWDIISDIIKLIEREEIKDLDNITFLHERYTNFYVDKLLAQWYQIIYHKENNTFTTKKDNDKDLINKILQKISPQNSIEQTKIFLWWKSEKIKQISIEFTREAKKVLEKNLNKWIIKIHSNSSEEEKKGIIQIMLDNFKWIRLKKDKSIGLKWKVDIVIVDKYRKKISDLLTEWWKDYDSLDYWYKKHFLPVWWKIHFTTSMKSEDVEKLQNAYLFGSTPFKLLHADTSILLPPCESPFQLVEVLNKLFSLWIINDWDLELQLSIAWRLNNELCWILGSSMIFMKNYQVTYPKEAFITSHNDLTKSCIICYDSWVLKKEWFSNIWKLRKWRTDILWIRKIEEVVIFSIISNLLSQAEFWGIHKEEWLKFIKEYKLLLKKYNLEYILEWKWVHNPDDKNLKNEDYSEHSTLINECTDILNLWIKEFNESKKINSIIFELRDLVWKYITNNNLLPTNINKINNKKVIN